MHGAAAVSYPVGRSAMRTAFYLAPVTLGGLACLAWALESAPEDFFPLPVLPVFLSWLMTSAWAASSVLRPAAGVLHWNGRNWLWEDNAQGRQGKEGQEGRIRVRLDWQSGLLLEFLPLSAKESGRLHRSTWLWLSRGADSASWDGLRRAVFAERS